MTSTRESFDRFYCMLSMFELGMISRGVDGKVSYGDALYLDIIHFNPGCTVSQLAEILNVSKPAVTVKINSLVEQGYVIKRKSEDDARVNYLELAPGMEDFFRQEADELEDVVRRLSETYSEEELRRFREILDTASSLMARDNRQEP